MPSSSSQSNTGLETLLEQRRQRLEDAHVELAAREREVAAQHGAVQSAQARLQTAYASLRAALQPSEDGLAVDVVQHVDSYVQALLHALECQRQALAQAEQAAGEARTELANAHVQVRTVEVLLERRALELATQARRQERRFEDEVAATAARRGATALAAGA